MQGELLTFCSSKFFKSSHLSFNIDLVSICHQISRELQNELGRAFQ
jgi:hypothetical protein